MWQVSGNHGYIPSKFDAIADMSRYANDGLTTFDLGDKYGPAQDFVGICSFRRGSLSNNLAKECQYLNTWSPTPTEEITRSFVDNEIDRCLERMNVDCIDLLQFSWSEYQNKNYFEIMSHLMVLKDQGKIRNIGLSTWSTSYMIDLIEEGAPIVTNQVAFSVIDTRPLNLMIKACKDNDVQLLCHGVLLGGFLSNYWLGQKEPNQTRITNISLSMYLKYIINQWGSWELFQEMLQTLNEIAKKYQVSISNVAIKWVLSQPNVAAVCIGAPLGDKSRKIDRSIYRYIIDHKSLSNYELDNNDITAIRHVQDKGNDLFNILGDCGDEYRRRTKKLSSSITY